MPSCSHVTTLIADATVRIPLQLWNFGTPVDGIGSCGSAWSSAIMTGQAAGPPAPCAARRLRCAAGAFLRPAARRQQRRAGLFFCAARRWCSTFFVCYVAYSYVMVAGAAFLNAFLALPAAAPR